MDNNLNHIAFIMDGNGRYAKNLNQPRTFGHLEGAKRIPEIILSCKEKNISHISFFAFSTENWNRPKNEIIFLMDLFKKYLSAKSLKWFLTNNINLKIIGFENNLSIKLIEKIKTFTKSTYKKTNLINVYIFFNYGSRMEIIETCKKLVANNIQINIENFNDNLLTNNIPDVDLLIRTSNEKRISNFMLWQIAYSEIIFEESKWPEYTIKVLDKNISEFYTRKRRFGGITNV